MTTETKDKDLIEFKNFLLQKERLKTPLNNLVKPFKFHHHQKLKIVEGYYKTFKGRVQASRLDKDNNNEYLILIAFRDEDVNEWIPENYLKIAIF